MADVKKILPTKPIQVKVNSQGQIYFITIYANGSLKIRPKGARRLDATAITSVGSVYRRILIVQARDLSTTGRARSVQRGLLSTERRGI